MVNYVGEAQIARVLVGKGTCKTMQAYAFVFICRCT
jgi:hypothetical protein